MTREDRLDLAVPVGREFRPHEMMQHRAHVVRYWLDVRDGRPLSTGSDELVVDWAIALQLPPYERAVEVRPMSSSCGCNPRHDSQRPIVGPDRWLVTCLACGRRWLELAGSTSATV